MSGVNLACHDISSSWVSGLNRCAVYISATMYLDLLHALKVRILCRIHIVHIVHTAKNAVYYTRMGAQADSSISRVECDCRARWDSDVNVSPLLFLPCVTMYLPCFSNVHCTTFSCFLNPSVCLHLICLLGTADHDVGEGDNADHADADADHADHADADADHADHADEDDGRRGGRVCG